MDNNINNQETIASTEKIQLATDLLSRSGLSSPATRLMCEGIIASKTESSINELVAGLQEMIMEKETAYKEFKQKMAEMAKEMLPAATNQPLS